MITVPHMLADATQLNSELNRTLHDRGKRNRYTSTEQFSSGFSLLCSYPPSTYTQSPSLLATRCVFTFSSLTEPSRAPVTHSVVCMATSIQPYFGMYIGRHDASFVESMSIALLSLPFSKSILAFLERVGQFVRLQLPDLQRVVQRAREQQLPRRIRHGARHHVRVTAEQLHAHRLLRPTGSAKPLGRLQLQIV